MKGVGKSLLNWVGVAFYNFLDSAINTSAINYLWVFTKSFLDCHCAILRCAKGEGSKRGEYLNGEESAGHTHQAPTSGLEHPAKTSVLSNG